MIITCLFIYKFHTSNNNLSVMELFEKYQDISSIETIAV